uniref:AP3-3 n=1 Tax=Anemone rivularis var. flore-minore TaxID=1836947 RepID=A0A172M5S2_9MAGN|nr:AP3-3 [Anemone rivularis var. flore-minore]
MGGGKIEIKRIENTTNRQVTYSKRRNGIMKKARELTVLCDAHVSLIMFSCTGKLAEYISPSTTAKKLYDQYQKATGVNLWNSQYEKLKESLKQQKEINMKLRKEIGRRTGMDSLDGESFEKLRSLEQDLEGISKVVRERKFHMISTQTETTRKKIRRQQEIYKRMVREIETRGQVLYDEGNLESIMAMSNGGGEDFVAYHLQSNLQEVEDYGSYGFQLSHI